MVNKNFFIFSFNIRFGLVIMIVNEYKVVMFIKSIIEKKGDMKLVVFIGYFSQVLESLRNIIGWIKSDLSKFFVDYGNIFIIIEDEVVFVIKNVRFNVIIIGSRF